MAACLLNRLRDERGFTLVEQLVVSAGLVVILGAILGLADVASKTGPVERERVHAIQEAQVGLDKMTRELRRAHAITIEPFKATADIMLNGSPVTVVYDCTVAVNGLRTCDRQQAGQTTQTVIARVANATSRPVFTAQVRNDASGIPWTTYVRTIVEVPGRGERTTGANARIVLDDGFYLRNVDALH